MSLQSTAQELIVVDPSMGPSMDHGMSLIPLEVHDVPDDYPATVEPSVEVHDHPEADLEIILDLPGAPPGTPDPQPLLEVVDEDSKHDEDEAKDKGKKNPKWDWESRGAKGFITWVKERLDDVPKHSGYDSAGLERAVAYLERVDNEVSKAMRMDLEGELDANQIEKVRSVIDNGIERLHERLDKVKSSKKKSRKKKASESDDGLVKEAQKITGVQGVFVTVDLLTSHIARVCINGMVSAGHDIEDLFERQAKYYDLDKRERAQVIQLLDDMGYTMRRDRGFMPDQDVDPASSDNMDWAANYNPTAEVWGKDR
jgi:hypothetical protein